MNFYVFEMGYEALETVGILNSVFYVEYQKGYSACGSFKLKCSLTQDNISICEKDNIVLLENGVCGVIEIISKEAENKQILISGSLAESLIGRRCTKKKQKFQNSDVSDILETLFEKATEESSLPLIETEFPNMDKHVDSIEVEAQSLQKTFEDFCNAYEIGYQVLLKSDLTGFVLSLYKGRDKSIGNEEGNAPVIISPEFDSARNNSQHEISTTEYYDKLYVVGSDNTTAILTLPTAEEDSMHTKEKVLNCSGMSKGDRTTKQYLNLLIEKGREEINNSLEKVTYETEVTDKTFAFGMDYGLGDIITAKDRTLEFQQNRRVNSYTMYYENGYRSVSVTFGEAQVDIQQVLVTTNKKIQSVRDLVNTAQNTFVSSETPKSGLSENDLWHKVASGSGAAVEAVYKFMKIPDGTPESDIIRLTSDDLLDTVKIDFNSEQQSTFASRTVNNEPQYSQTQEDRAWVKQGNNGGGEAVEYVAGDNIYFAEIGGKTYINAVGGGSGGGIITGHANFGSAATTVINSAEYKNERTVTVPWKRNGKTLRGFIVHGYIAADDLMSRRQLLEFSKMGFEGAESEYMTDYMKYPLQLTEITGYNSANRPIYERLVYWGVSYSGMYTDNITFRVVDRQYGLNRSSEWSIDLIYG